MKSWFIILVALTYSFSLAFGSAQQASHPAAINAFENYYEAFTSYENKLKQKRQSEIAKDWQKASDNYKAGQDLSQKEDLSDLKAAIESYTLYLEENPEASNRPDALLNLSHTLIKTAGVYDQSDSTISAKYREEAVNILASIAKDYPRFDKVDETKYLLAIQYELTGREVLAANIWQNLSKANNASIFKFYALIALGDKSFNKEKSEVALALYRKASNVIKQTKYTSEQDFELARAQYRIAWAAYRSADLSLCISTSIQILSPGRNLRYSTQKEEILADTYELLGDALYENNDVAYTKAILGRSVLKRHSSAISVRVLQRYMAAKSYENIINIGSYVVDLLPKSKHLPDLLTILADTYQQTNQIELRLESLEKLAILLPKSSLWRKSYANDFESIATMEIKAFSANAVLANHYYQVGLISSNRSALITAAAYYADLINFAPHHQESTDWNLKTGHANYLAGLYEESAKIYKNLIATKNLSSKHLQVASYQNILAEEALLRRAIALDETESTKVKEDSYNALQELEKLVENYANRFANSDYKVKALLKLAAASRDIQLHQKASGIWQRVLVSRPKPSERLVALRGIAHASTQYQSRQESIALISNYLKLEDWKKLGRSLKNEFRSLLTATVKAESDLLNESGDLFEAAQLLRNTVADHPYLPQADALKRDAAYLFAIAGNWQDALNICQDGLKNKRFKHKADLRYLKARAEEFQLRFPEAASSYFNFAIEHPRHKRAGVALARAQRLASAEGRLLIAAKAAGLRAKQASSEKDKIKLYLEAMNYYIKEGAHQQALIAAQNSKKFAKTIAERLRGRLAIAERLHALEKTAEALKEYKAIAADAKRYKSQISTAVFAETYGKTNYLLGLEHYKDYQDFNSSSVSKVHLSYLNDKAKMFEKVTNYFTAAISSGHPEYRVMSRYLIGESAETLAYELKSAAIGRKADSRVGERELTLRSDKLYALAKQYYSDNILDNTRQPNLFYNNPYVKKSAIKVTGIMPDQSTSQSYESLPVAASDLIPQQWSLR